MNSYILADSDGKIIEVNQAYCDLIGYSNTALRKLPYESELSDKSLERALLEIAFYVLKVNLLGKYVSFRRIIK